MVSKLLFSQLFYRSRAWPISNLEELWSFTWLEKSVGHYFPRYKKNSSLCSWREVGSNQPAKELQDWQVKCCSNNWNL